MDFFIGGGRSHAQAAEIVPIRQAESDLRPDAVGDSGLALAWHNGTPDRRAAFQRLSGRAMRGSTFEEWLRFAQHEPSKGGEARAGQLLTGATSANNAGSIVAQDYERPVDRYGKAIRDGHRAEQIVNQFTNP